MRRGPRYIEVGPGGHVALDTVRAFEAALARAGAERVELPTRALRPIAKALSKMRLVPTRRQATGRPFIVTMMGPMEHRLFPVSFLAPVVIYAFDVWPAEYGWWTHMFRRHGVTTAFFTSRESADWFGATGTLQSAFWLPEGTDVDEFDPSRRLRNRGIHVLEMGRRHPVVHDGIRASLLGSAVTHLYQRSPAELVFPSRAALVAGLADTRISLCYPASDTHPELVRGGAEVLTQRYLEALASGCLIVGRAPADLITLLGFDPVVALDREAPGEHLRDILKHIDDYQAHVDRTLGRVREVGTWDDRVRQLVTVLDTAAAS